MHKTFLQDLPVFNGQKTKNEVFPRKGPFVLILHLIGRFDACDQFFLVATVFVKVSTVGYQDRILKFVCKTHIGPICSNKNAFVKDS